MKKNSGLEKKSKILYISAMKRLFLAFILICNAAFAHKVLISIPAYEELINKLDPEIEIINLIPPDIDPHIYEVTIKQTNILKEADLWFCIGEHFEAKIKQNFPKEKIVDLRKSLALLPKNIPFEAQDKHIWLSLKLLTQQIDTISSALIKLAPEKERALIQNKEKLLREIEKLSSEINQILLPLKDCAVLVSHPSLTYFCHDYFLEQVSIESASEGNFKKLNEMLTRAKKNDLFLIIGQPQHNNKIAAYIAATVQKPYIMIDPYKKNIFENIKSIAETIAKQHESRSN